MPDIKIPTQILVDKNPAYPAAMRTLKEVGVLPEKTELIQVNHANDILEQDHRFTKLKVKHGMWFNSFSAAQNTIAGYETMHMIKKG